MTEPANGKVRTRVYLAVESRLSEVESVGEVLGQASRYLDRLREEELTRWSRLLADERTAEAALEKAGVEVSALGDELVCAIEAVRLADRSADVGLVVHQEVDGGWGVSGFSLPPALVGWLGSLRAYITVDQGIDCS